MQALQVESVSPPLDDPELLAETARLLARVEAMGLLPKGRVIRRLDLAALQRVAKALAKVHVGLRPAAEAMASRAGEVKNLRRLVQELSRGLERSPVPSTEWGAVSEVLDDQTLSALLGISSSSLQRYRRAERPTPDDVAERLHFVALVIADLAGAYNEIGIRNWFQRPRVVLKRKSPLEVLTGDWSPDGASAERLKQLARSLTASPAT